MSGKLFIVLLAVCLVSAHAFVKRDAPTTESNYVENLPKQLQDFAKNINEQVSDALKPETIKKNVNDVLDSLQKALNDLKEKTNSAQTPNQ